MRRSGLTAARRHREDRESGQAMVEFALILFPLLMLVVDHPIRHRAELLARHEPHRKPGRALGSCSFDNWPPYCARSEPSCGSSATPPANPSTGTLKPVAIEGAATGCSAVLTSKQPCGDDLLSGQDAGWERYQRSHSGRLGRGQTHGAVHTLLR